VSGEYKNGPAGNTIESIGTMGYSLTLNQILIIFNQKRDEKRNLHSLQLPGRRNLPGSGPNRGHASENRLCTDGRHPIAAGRNGRARCAQPRPHTGCTPQRKKIGDRG
jgi:hypothetical protein